MTSQKIYQKLLILAGCAALTLAANVNDSQAATANASSTGIVVTPIAIEKSADLNFGKFASGATPGTVVVGTDDVNSPSGGVTLLTGAASAAKFSITGEASSTYALTLPPSVTMSSGANTITVGSFTTLVDDGSVGGLPAGGSQVLTIGATATVAASQASGTYTGTLAVTVEYN